MFMCPGIFTKTVGEQPKGHIGLNSKDEDEEEEEEDDDDKSR